MKMLIRKGRRKGEKQLDAHGTKGRFTKLCGRRTPDQKGIKHASLTFRECLAAHTLLGELAPSHWRSFQPKQLSHSIFPIKAALS